MRFNDSKTFTVQNPAHYLFGRTFVITGYNADKGGARYAICEEINDKASIKPSYIFYVADLVS